MAILRPIKPRRTSMEKARIVGKTNAFLRGFTADFVREISRYPPQQPTEYVRTGTLGRNWSQRIRYKPDSVSIENLTPYGVYVQGPPDGPPRRRQTAVMRGKGWPNVKTEGQKALKKNLVKLKGLK